MKKKWMECLIGVRFSIEDQKMATQQSHDKINVAKKSLSNVKK
jgi:chaperone required for assembly of F1-ATPase